MNTSNLASASIELPEQLTGLLNDLGIRSFTPIQQQSLPDILAGKDLIAQAQTGSGKTLAFAIGLVMQLNPRFFGCQSLVLCPTRELADQVAKEIRKIARYRENIKVLTLCGGMPFGPQIASLEHGAHIVVGTPGRIMEHLRKGNLDLSNLNNLVLDEADRMLDMGFIDSIRDIVALTPKRRQTLLFSATYSDNIAQISEEFQRSPRFIKIEAEPDTQPNIDQYFVRANNDQKPQAILDTLFHVEPRQVIVFCNTKAECDEVADWLNQHNISAMAIHGDFDQRDRDQVLVRFANKSCSVLVATDVAARGIDVKEIDLVINYDTTRDIDVHTHRIGRTGRAGAAGMAVSFITQREDYKLSDIAARFNIEPEFLQLRNCPSSYQLQPDVATIAFDAGKKNKLRAGDILGALTAGLGLEKSDVGKIDIFDFRAYVAVDKHLARDVVKGLAQKKIKGKNIKSRVLR
ncbi:ATP-dependent RNA helicase DbpA [Marinomonas ostreistagni]|uniref:ATP-dependent RNA helicase DbpA n=1 Tax=Marinomonas ostreistagni TaxID=359209 RepID=UPI00194DC8F2|nr:ATP-dependent RNA helicase DbpA [Marinomonas ostreistagni]MBM6551898.1 ATP-dependent RNA helicase DbpA [Marinomonas ostreistagni]